MIRQPLRTLRRSAVLALWSAILIAGLAVPVGADPGHHDESGMVVAKFGPNADADRLAAEHGLIVDAPVVASKGILRLRKDPDHELAKKNVKDLAKYLAKESGVLWAEPEVDGENVDGDRFHAWPDGLPTSVGSDPDAWLNQPNLGYLDLAQVHSRTTGAGMRVALLDTGVDLDHPSLAGHLAAGSSGLAHFDYVDDDPRPMEEANGVDDDGDGRTDEAFGHGTHTAGLVALIAPDAELLIYRVLDSDGGGNAYVVAQAINDAVAAGVDVINVSFGMDGKPKSKVLKEAFKNAEKQNVAIVAAVGNKGDKGERFPSREKNVIGVAAMANGNAYLAGFSNHGKPALVAAPGEDIVSTLPGGGFGAWSGTSMAAPIVAGQVALVRSTHRDLKVKKVVEIVGKSARKIHGKRKVEKGLVDILRSVEYD